MIIVFVRETVHATLETSPHSLSRSFSIPQLCGKRNRYKRSFAAENI